MGGRQIFLKLRICFTVFAITGDFREDCMNIIMNDLIRLMDRNISRYEGKFTPRERNFIDPYCNYGKPGNQMGRKQPGTGCQTMICIRKK